MFSKAHSASGATSSRSRLPFPSTSCSHHSISQPAKLVSDLLDDRFVEARKLCELTSSSNLCLARSISCSMTDWSAASLLAFSAALVADEVRRLAGVRVDI
jgi:hypothetical protein